HGSSPSKWMPCHARMNAPGSRSPRERPLADCGREAIGSCGGRTARRRGGPRDLRGQEIFDGDDPAREFDRQDRRDRQCDDAGACEGPVAREAVELDGTAVVRVERDGAEEREAERDREDGGRYGIEASLSAPE